MTQPNGPSRNCRPSPITATAKARTMRVRVNCGTRAIRLNVSGNFIGDN